MDDVHERVYADISGYALSRRDRPVGDPSFTYSEIAEADAFSRVLAHAQPVAGDVFCDLGAGTGKAVHAAALSGLGFGRCVGVELLESLHTASEEAHRAIAAQVPSIAEVELRRGDILEVDWSEADVVFSNSLCFGTQLWSALQLRLRSLKPGARLLTLRLPEMSGGHWRHCGVQSCRMSWDQAVTVHVLRRTETP